MSSNTLTCNGDEMCQDVIANYCFSCSLFFCETCHTIHRNQHGGSNTMLPVTFENHGKLAALCTEHNLPAHLVCCRNTFICLQCKEGEHEGHYSSDVAVFAEEIRKGLEKQKMYITDLEAVLENSSKCLNTVECDISTLRELLQISLRKRMVKCLSDYVVNLSGEEERLLKQFDALSQTHIQEYHDNNPSYFFDMLSRKTDFQVISENEKLYEIVTKFAHREFTVPQLALSMTDAEENSMQPLGHMCVDVGQPISINQSKSTSSFIGNFPETDVIEITSGLIKKLESLLETVLVVNDNPSNLICDRITEEEIDVKEENSLIEPQIDINRLNQSLKLLEEKGFAYVNELIRRKDYESLQIILSQRQDVVKMNNGYYKHTALHRAALYDNVPIAQLLVKNGAYMFEEDVRGYNMLHFAACNNAIAMMKWILEFEEFVSNINSADNSKQTAMHLASSHGHFKCVKLLLEKECALNVRDSNGETPLGLARRNKHREVVKILQLAM